MIIDLAAYRPRKAPPQHVMEAEQTLLCANGDPIHVVLPWRAAVAPIASPALPGNADDDLDAFHSLAYALATQI